jgi:hypothetical protein
LLDKDRRPFLASLVGLVAMTILAFLLFAQIDDQYLSDSTDSLIPSDTQSHHGITDSDRERIAEWVAGFINQNSAGETLSSEMVPIYYNSEVDGLLGIVGLGNTEFLFASSYYEPTMALCELFSSFNYTENEITLTDCPNAVVQYNKDADSFSLDYFIDGCSCGMNARLSGDYVRIATAVCRLSSDGALTVVDIR